MINNLPFITSNYSSEDFSKINDFYKQNKDYLIFNNVRRRLGKAPLRKINKSKRKKILKEFEFLLHNYVQAEIDRMILEETKHWFENFTNINDIELGENMKNET